MLYIFSENMSVSIPPQLLFIMCITVAVMRKTPVFENVTRESGIDSLAVIPSAGDIRTV